jgi:dienelactone hydrolase
MMLRLKLWAAAAGAFLMALAAFWFGGRKSAQADAKRKEAEDYVDTRKRIDEVARMSDADAARDWLRERGKQ